MSKRVLITGGANGLGYHMGQHYSEQGNEVIALDLERGMLRDNVEFHFFDLSRVEDQTISDLKTGFDIVICNAGISVSGDFTEIPFEQEENVLNINFIGHMKLIKILLKRNLINEGGRIVFICSATQYLSFPIALAYGASKGALDGFAQALESYLIPQNISVTRVYPGPMNTAHSKYYPGASTEGGRLPQQSVPVIVKGIEKRKRKICPDPISRFYRIASKIVPKTLSKKTYNFYKERLTASHS